MKLLYCSQCGDVRALGIQTWRTCACKESGGQYNKDTVTATIGGLARVFGVSNLFFNEMWPVLTVEQKQVVRESYKLDPLTDCWWGDFKGDNQLFRVANSNGPRLKIKVVRMDPYTNKVIITDHRSFTVNMVEKPKGYEVLVPFNRKM